jgi:acetyl-CoA/propionyl-CoA carboxylase biotin carboxyl carrier protein
MVAKLIVHGVDREHARRRMLRALDEFWIEGPTTLIGFHKALLSHPCFVAGETCHGIAESAELVADLSDAVVAPPAGLVSGAGKTTERVRTVEVDGRHFEVRLSEPEPEWRALAQRRRERAHPGGGGAGGSDAVVSPMQGTVLSVAVADGDAVEAGQVICIVEAMKMENEVHAHRAGAVGNLSVEPGQPVTNGQVICRIEAD